MKKVFAVLCLLGLLLTICAPGYAHGGFNNYSGRGGTYISLSLGNGGYGYSNGYGYGNNYGHNRHHYATSYRNCVVPVTYRPPVIKHTVCNYGTCYPVYNTFSGRYYRY